MNCQKYRNTIEELTGGQTLSADALRHLENCLDCHAFKTERERLRALMSCLEKVNAPANFEFGVKAKLQNVRPAPAFYRDRKLIFGVPALGAAVLAVAIGGNYFPNQTNTNPPSIVKTELVPTKLETSPANSNQNKSVAVSETNPSQINPTNVVAPAAPANSQVARVPAMRKQGMTKPETISRRNNNANVDREDDPVAGSVTSGVGGNPKVTSPKGIELNKPLDAQEALRTYGVETEADSDGLRVKTVKSADSGLKSGDVIQKIDNKPLNELKSGQSLRMILTVKGEDGTKEIELKKAPPQKK